MLGPGNHSLSALLSPQALASVCFSISLFASPTIHAKPGNSKKTPIVVVEQSQLESVIKQVPISGTVTSPKVARISPEVSGRVKKVTVDIGDVVTKSHTLLNLDPEIQKLKLKADQAATQKFKQELAEAKRRYESGKRLSKQNSISKEELEQRLAAVRIAEASLAQQEAIEHRQQAIVNRHWIKAPFNGVISQKHTEAGEWVDTGKTVITLVSMDNLKLDFQVSQEYFSQVNSSSRIQVRLDALPGKNVDADIETIVPINDPNARTFLLRAKLNKPLKNLNPGMSAQGILKLNTGAVGVIVSRDAIVRYRDGRVTVWVVYTEGEIPKVKEQAVEIGHSYDGKVSITQGLEANTLVVVEGNEGLKQGQNIKIHSSR